MPCDSISQVEVQFGPDTDSKLIHAALQELGLRPVEQGNYIRFSTGEYDKTTHQFTFRGAMGEKHAQEIKRAYSVATVKSQAQRMGWTLKATTQKAQVQQRR